MSPIFAHPRRPRRDFRAPILVFAVVGFCSLIFTLVSLTVMTHRYREMMQYVHEMPCARQGDTESNRPPCQTPAQTMTVVGASPYVVTRHRRSGDTQETRYALQLRDVGGRIVTERGIDEKVGQAAAVGRTVTAEFWHEKLTMIDIDGHFSTTSNAPFDAAEQSVAPTFIGLFIVMACGVTLSTLRKINRRGI